MTDIQTSFIDERAHHKTVHVQTKASPFVHCHALIHDFSPTERKGGRNDSVQTVFNAICNVIRDAISNDISRSLPHPPNFRLSDKEKAEGQIQQNHDTTGSRQSNSLRVEMRQKVG